MDVEICDELSMKNTTYKPFLVLTVGILIVDE